MKRLLLLPALLVAALIPSPSPMLASVTVDPWADMPQGDPHRGSRIFGRPRTGGWVRFHGTDVTAPDPATTGRKRRRGRAPRRR